MKIERIQADNIPVVTDRQKRDQKTTVTEHAVRFKDEGRRNSGQNSGHYQRPDTEQSEAAGAEAIEKKEGESSTSDHLHIVA
jgi:hypothetical protein